MNIRTVIVALSQAKEDCYSLASAAYKNGNWAEQRRLYALADAAQHALDAALALESEQDAALAQPSVPMFNLYDFSEVA